MLSWRESLLFTSSTKRLLSAEMSSTALCTAPLRMQAQQARRQAPSFLPAVKALGEALPGRLHSQAASEAHGRPSRCLFFLTSICSTAQAQLNASMQGLLQYQVPNHLLPQSFPDPYWPWSWFTCPWDASEVGKRW
jgi:hypothetical protein